MALLLSSLSLQSFQRPVDHTSFKAGTLALMLHGTEQLTAPLYITDHNLPLTLTQIRIIYAQAIKVNCYFLLTFAKLVFLSFKDDGLIKLVWLFHMRFEENTGLETSFCIPTFFILCNHYGYLTTFFYLLLPLFPMTDI